MPTRKLPLGASSFASPSACAGAPSRPVDASASRAVRAKSPGRGPHVASSLRADVGGLQHRLPFGRLGVHVGVEVLGESRPAPRRSCRASTARSGPAAPPSDRSRASPRSPAAFGRSKNAPPDRDVVAGDAGFRDGRDIRQRLGALGRGHRERAHRAAFELADRFRQRIDAERNVASDHSGQRRCAALVGDRDDLAPDMYSSSSPARCAEVPLPDMP